MVKVINCRLLGLLLLGLWNGSAFEVELKELVNPSVAGVRDSPYSGRDSTCAPAGCTSILTRDGSRSAGSRYGCTQQDVSSSRNTCTVTYRLNENKYSGGTQRTISSVYVAFTADSETTLQVLVDHEEVFPNSWAGETGSTKLQEIPGVRGYIGDELELVALMSEGGYIGITETEIYVEVDKVPVTGISASERVSVTASATVNSGSAMDTLDGNTGNTSSWTCSEGDVCEITYDLEEVQSTQQVRIAFVEESYTIGATFNVYTAGVDGVFSSVLSGVSAGTRDSSLEGLQTFGGVRALARYVKIEGVPGSGGEFSISEVDIRVNEDAPAYPTTVDSSLVPLGRLPLGGTSVPYDPRPASEGGCSAGHFEGCHIYYIKDGDDSPNSRWSCSPTVVTSGTSVCHAEFRLNVQTYLRQIQLAFYKGDERHTEFSITVHTESGWVIAVPSAISSGDTTDLQTWDIPAWTSIIEIRPMFGSAADWISVKEMILLGEKQSEDSTPIRRYANSETSFTLDLLPISALTTNFSFDLQNVDSEADIFLGGSGQTARVWAVDMKFPSRKSFTFDIRYYDEERSLISMRFTTAGGDEKWEEFVLPEVVTLRTLTIVAVEGTDEEDYPTLRVNDCQVIGEPYTPGSKTVVSTTIEAWYAIPDYIGDGIGDQEEIMQAICDGIGETFDGTDCDGVATGEEKTPEVNLVDGDYYLDGPVFLKSGITLRGERVDGGDFYATYLRMHGGGTGADGIINADGVLGALVENIGVRSNLESAGTSGTVGNVGFDIKHSEDITIDMAGWDGCPLSGTRFVDTDGVRADELYGSGSGEGPDLILEGVTDFILKESRVQGASIKDSVNVSVEGGVDNGELYGSIELPKGGDQSANLVVSGTTSGVTLKDISLASGAEPRIVLKNSNAFTVDAVTFSGGDAGDCIIQTPQDSDGDAVLVQRNVETVLLLEDNCFVLA